MDHSDLQIRVDPPAATIVIDRPQCRNALSLNNVADLLQLLSDCHSENRIHAVIITGAGPAFCSGSDLKALQASYAETQSLQMFENWQLQTLQYVQLLETMLRFPKPIIAAVNGPVVGVGMALMLAADYVVASDTAKFSCPEARRGLSPSLTAPLLVFRSTSAVANRILFAGEEPDAESAHRLGLVHEVVAVDYVWAQAFEMAKQFAQGARESHQMTKRMLNEIIGETLLTQLNVGAANMAAARITDAAKEGVAAFLEKREPNWG